jgi:hypothetical protein
MQSGRIHQVTALHDKAALSCMVFTWRLGAAGNDAEPAEIGSWQSPDG